jgi:3D (Asp-Asp-Asp) domain-containing protein
MLHRFILSACVSVFFVALTGCGMFNGSPTVLSSADAARIASSGSSSYMRKMAKMPFAPAAPSRRVRNDVARGNLDRHGMPVYKISERHRYVRTTAYTSRESDHLQYGAMNAAGTPLRFTRRVRSAAADWSVYPVGTVFKIKGLPYLYVVDDYGSALVGTHTVDLYMPNHAWMRAWGMRKVEVSVVKWGSFERSLQLLSKRTRHPQCRRMYASILRRFPNLAVAAR